MGLMAKSRHSFVSLLIAEGRSIVDVARQAGHSATMALDTYGHVFDELEGLSRGPLTDSNRRPPRLPQRVHGKETEPRASLPRTPSARRVRTWCGPRRFPLPPQRTKPCDLQSQPAATVLACCCGFGADAICH